VNHLRRNPSGIFSFRTFTAAAYDGFKVGIDGGLKFSASASPAEPAGNVKGINVENTAGVRSEPSEEMVSRSAVIFKGPRKDTVGISVEKPSGSQLSADSEQPVVIGIVNIRKKAGHRFAE
jgi:hypothetical protein